MKKVLKWSLIVASFGLAGCKSLYDYTNDVTKKDPSKVTESETSGTSRNSGSAYDKKIMAVKDESTNEKNRSKRERARLVVYNDGQEEVDDIDEMLDNNDTDLENKPIDKPTKKQSPTSVDYKKPGEKQKGKVEPRK